MRLRTFRFISTLSLGSCSWRPLISAPVPVRNCVAASPHANHGPKTMRSNESEVQYTWIIFSILQLHHITRYSHHVYRHWISEVSPCRPLKTCNYQILLWTAGFWAPPSRRKLTLSACGFGILRALGAQAFLSRYVDTGWYGMIGLRAKTHGIPCRSLNVQCNFWMFIPPIMVSKWFWSFGITQGTAPYCSTIHNLYRPLQARFYCRSQRCCPRGMEG